MDSEIEKLSTEQLRNRLKEKHCATHGEREDLINRLKWAVDANPNRHESETVSRSSLKERISNKQARSGIQRPRPERRNQYDSKPRPPVRGQVNPLYKRIRMNQNPVGAGGPFSADSGSPNRDQNLLPDPRHMPTRSVCIQHLSRPLQIQLLKQKIEAFSGEPAEQFWLDNLRSHCFVTFPSLESAISVRKNMHNLKYPENVSTKAPLFVDYVPTEEVGGYIEKEGSERRSLKRWIIRYNGPDNEAIAEHIEEPDHRLDKPKRIEVDDDFFGSDLGVVYETKTEPRIRFAEASLSLIRERTNV